MPHHCKSCAYKWWGTLQLAWEKQQVEYSNHIPMRTFAFLLLLSPLFAANYDVLVTNARVIDGSGNAWFRADVAVKDGRIAAIGRLPGVTATRTIDARERVLAPGFIDVHTRSEEHTSELQSLRHLVCRLLLEKKKNI